MASGKRYIPSERDRNVQNATTVGDVLNIYRVPTLSDSCYGPVTAIEYCYTYRSSAGSGSEPMFNWTVLILEDTAESNSLRISRIYSIYSRGSSSVSANCTNSGTCCDVTNIDRFDLPMPNNFIFGVTGSAQGNTRGAALQGFADGLPEYRVNAIQFNKVGLNLSVGSTINIPVNSMLQTGLRRLWFIIGKHLSKE